MHEGKFTVTPNVATNGLQRRTAFRRMENTLPAAVGPIDQ